LSRLFVKEQEARPRARLFDFKDLVPPLIPAALGCDAGVQLELARV
jgi:hypothetical protein